MTKLENEYIISMCQLNCRACFTETLRVAVGGEESPSITEQDAC